MAKKTILEALTRIVLQARPRPSCYSQWRYVEQFFPDLGKSGVVAPRSGLQVIARTVSLKRTRQECGFGGRHTFRSMTSRWICPVKMSTISGHWVDLS
jgi:hypothetical protein